MSEAQTQEPSGGPADPATIATQTAPDPVEGSDGGAAAAPDAGTLTGGDALEGEAKPSPEIELDALRKAIAGDNDKLLGQLNRYKSAEAIGKAFSDHSEKARAKQTPLTLDDKATDDQIKAYRDAVGLGEVEEADKYPVGFREGFEASEADTALLGTFKDAMNAKNVDPRSAEAAMEWYQDFAEQVEQDKAELMAKTAKETQATLRAEYGGEYDGNIAAGQELIKTHVGEDGFNAMMDMRLEDGSRLQDNIEFVRLMVQIGGDYYGGTGIVNGDVESTAKTAEQRLNDLTELRRTDPEKYKSDAVQKEVSELSLQLDKINSRR